MNSLQVCVCFILILISITLIVSFLADSNTQGQGQPGPIPGSTKFKPSTIVYSLTSALPNGGTYSDAQENFIVTGFTFTNRPLVTVRKVTKLFYPIGPAWILYGQSTIGKISLSNLQREQYKLQSVIVVIRYWKWENKSTLVLVATSDSPADRSPASPDSTIEEETQILPETPGETPGGYCQRILYFGPVDNISVIGELGDYPWSIIIITSLKIIVGPAPISEDSEEMVCD